MTKQANLHRCQGALEGNILYQAYHDTEWGVLCGAVIP